MSSNPTPVQSNKVILSDDNLLLSWPSITSPIAVICSGLINLEPITCWVAPNDIDWAKSSVKTVALATNYGATSCLPVVFVPIQAIRVPGLIHSYLNSGWCAEVIVMSPIGEHRSRSEWSHSMTSPAPMHTSVCQCITDRFNLSSPILRQLAQPLLVNLIEWAWVRYWTKPQRHHTWEY